MSGDGHVDADDHLGVSGSRNRTGRDETQTSHDVTGIGGKSERKTRLEFWRDDRERKVVAMGNLQSFDSKNSGQ